MAIWLRQSTASQEVPLGYFVDSEDGDTEETALTISNTDIKLWKMGATTLANKNSGGATHISNGVYYCVLDATDTNTLGALIIFVHESGALPIRVECMVLAANVYDALVPATDKLQVHADEITNGLITAAAVATGAIDADAIADNAIDAGAIASNAITSAKIATDAITSDEIAAAGANKIADHTLKRNMATSRASSDGDGSGRFILQAFSFLRNRRRDDSGTLRVYQENDTTEDWNAPLTTSGTADPITEVDPT